VDVNACTGAAAEQWQYQRNGSMFNAQSRLCLDDPNASTASGTQLQVRACASSSREQAWALPEAIVR
jgi:hypothetical protein